ncbi:MAG: N-acetylmuramoyl-L-alanine amidase, partial [Oscillospiraceae bacterium]
GYINLYMAYMLNHRLKALGANVFMTRTSDELLPIYDRTVRASEAKPSLIISIDNDCFAEDFNSPQVLKIKYDSSNNYSENFAVNINKNLRKDFSYFETEIEENNEKIIKSTYCPSISVSLGNVFVPNIYKSVSMTNNIYNIIYSISNSVVSAYRQG